MAYVVAEPCIGTKDAACVDACPVDWIPPKKNTTYDDRRPVFDEVMQLYIDPVECIVWGPAYRFVRPLQFLRWTIFPKSGSTARNLMQATSKPANSHGPNTPSTRRSRRNREDQRP